MTGQTMPIRPSRPDSFSVGRAGQPDENAAPSGCIAVWAGLSPRLSASRLRSTGTAELPLEHVFALWLDDPNVQVRH